MTTVDSSVNFQAKFLQAIREKGSCEINKLMASTPLEKNIGPRSMAQGHNTEMKYS